MRRQQWHPWRCWSRSCFPAGATFPPPSGKRQRSPALPAALRSASAAATPARRRSWSLPPVPAARLQRFQPAVPGDYARRIRMALAVPAGNSGMLVGKCGDVARMPPSDNAPPSRGAFDSRRSLVNATLSFATTTSTSPQGLSTTRFGFTMSEICRIHNPWPRTLAAANFTAAAGETFDSNPGIEH
jgi:hypothetical protein